GNLLDPNRNFNNWYYAIYPIGMGVFAVSMIGGALGYLYSRRNGWQTLNLWRIGVLLLYGLAALMITSTFSNVWLGAGKIRHVLPTSIAVMAAWGAAVAQLIWTVQRWLSERAPEFRRIWLAPVGILTLIGVALLPSYVSGNLDLIRRFNETS